MRERDSINIGGPRLKPDPMLKDSFRAALLSQEDFWTNVAADISASFAESNRNSSICGFYLIGQNIDEEYKNYLKYKFLITL